MAIEFDNSVLPIISVGSRELLGTSFVISPRLLLTCAHVLPELRVTANGLTQLPPEIAVLEGDTACWPSDIHVSRALDAACMVFNEPLTPAPVSLVRAYELKSTSLSVVGFSRKPKPISRHIAKSLRVIEDELKLGARGYLQFAQLLGGAPEGFSGGPVLAESEQGWVAVGMIQQGRESSPISRFVATDPIAAFLLEHGQSIAVGEFRPKPPAAPRGESGVQQIMNIGSISGNSPVQQTLIIKKD